MTTSLRKWPAIALPLESGHIIEVGGKRDQLQWEATSGP
jgi:hypothetical protein